MAAEFIAYIDESGDQGFKFYEDEHKPGSKRWFVLSAVIVRSSKDPALRDLIAMLRERLRLQAKQPIHFSDLNHSQKVVAMDTISKMPIRVINVLIEKERLDEPERFEEKGFRLYFYAMRLLLERISWLCRDAPQAGQCRLVFERCKGMNYDDLEDYLNVLRGIGEDPFADEPVKIAWDFVDVSRPKIAHKDLIGALQIADCCASGVGWAVEKRLGHTEHRFAKQLKPRVYSRNGNFRSYGMKFLVPNPDLHWADKHYQ